MNEEKNITPTEAHRTFLTSDLHLNHRNIIRYCNRPFRDVHEMNQALIANWNETVRPEDTVYFIGDLCSRSDPLLWLRELNGHKILIKGNHDRHIPTHFTIHYEIINIDGLSLFLVHNPHDAPPDWDGWVIHGHKHIHWPFIDRERRRVNVSVEWTGYRPISLASILTTIGDGNGNANK